MQKAISVPGVIVVMVEKVRGRIDQSHDVSFSRKVVPGSSQKIGRSSVLLSRHKIQRTVAPDKQHQDSYEIDRRKDRRISIARVYEQVPYRGSVGIIKSCTVASDFHNLNHRPSTMSLTDSPWPTPNENRNYDNHD